MIEYNAMIHASTGESPFFMMFGHDFRFPLQILDSTGSKDELEWNNSKLSEIAERIRKAMQRINVAHSYNTKAYNRKRIPHLLKVGDLVMEATMVNTSKKNLLHKKLKLPGKGPYKIKRISDDNNTVTITEVSAGLKSERRVVNVSRIKKYIERPEWMRNPY